MNDIKQQNSEKVVEQSSQIDTIFKHKDRHIVLHKCLDELIADFIMHTNKFPSKTTLMELMEWSYKQQINTDEL